MWWSRDPLFRIFEPPNIPGTVKAENFTFGTDMDGSEY